MGEEDKKFRAPAFRKIMSLAGQAIHKYNMIADGDRLLVGISGGKDSLMLMHVLEMLRRRAPIDFELFPVCFFPGFTEFNIDVLKEYFQRQGWVLNVVSLDVPAIITEKHAEDQPCVLCSRLRRGHLYGEADRLNCGKIVLGQHLDDLCVSLLIGLFRGQGMMTMGPNVAGDQESKRVIRPLAMTPESLIRDAMGAFEFPSCGECHYKALLDRDGDRAFFKRMLEDLSVRIPDVRQYMLHSMSDLRLEHLLDTRYIGGKKNADRK